MQIPFTRRPRREPETTTAAAAPSAPRPFTEVTGLSLANGRVYGSGYTDEDVERMADEDAKASVHDNALWDENARHTLGIDLINRAHEVNIGLIAIALRAEALPIQERIETSYASARHAEQEALHAIDEDRGTQARHPTWGPDALGHVAASCTRHAELVAEHNALVSRLNAVVAQAGHHVQISAYDTARQAVLYARRVQLSQPEPVQERLLPEQLPEPRLVSGVELLEQMVGVTELPVRALLTTDEVIRRRAALDDTTKDAA
jgi:hypothetical protein